MVADARARDALAQRFADAAVAVSAASVTYAAKYLRMAAADP